MRTDRRRVYTVAIVFAVILLIGVVYAAITGALNFGGTARLTNTKLIIVDEAITDKTANESIFVNVPKDTLTFTVHLDKPNDTRYVTFKIENTGNVDAVLGKLDTELPEAETGIVVKWPELDGVVIPKNGTSAEYTIEVHWDNDYDEADQDVNLSATITYAQYRASDVSDVDSD